MVNSRRKTSYGLMETSASGGATPTHTTVPPGLAVSTAARIVSGRPTHSNALSAMPSVNDSGSTGTAPTSRTRSRLPGSGSLTSTSDEPAATRSEEHTSELQSHSDLVCRLLLEKKKKK